MTSRTSHTKALETLGQVRKHLTDSKVSAEDRAAYLAAIFGPSSLHDAALTALDELTRKKGLSQRTRAICDLAWMRIENPAMRILLAEDIFGTSDAAHAPIARGTTAFEDRSRPKP